MDKNAIRNILTIMIVVFLGLPVSAEVLGTYTTNEYFYLPAYGEFGEEAFDEYNLYMQKADTQIQANKEAIVDWTVDQDPLKIHANNYVDTNTTYTAGTGMQLDGNTFKCTVTDTNTTYSAGTGLSLTGTTFSSTITQYTDNLAISAIKNDNAWNASNWDTAYGWGDHSAAGYLTTVALNDISDVNTTGVADGKIIKYDIVTSKWIIADDEDTGTTYTAGTGLDLTGTVFSLDASAFDLSDFPADPNDDRYLFWNDTTNTITWAEGSGSGVTTFVGLTDTPLNYTGYAGYFPKVNAGATALEFAELTESDITDLGTYLTDITSESFADLSDIPAHPGVATKILETTADGYQYIDTPSGSGGEVNTASNIGGQIEIFKQKDGVDLEFRTLRAGTGIDLYNSVPTGAWDITNCSYDSISKDVSSQEGNPYDVAFNSDGSKMYIMGYSKTVFQYTLSTPWNVGTATYDNISKSVSSQDSYPYAVAFNPDGSKMYIMGYSNKTVYQYTLSTPWNVSTATYDSISKDISSQEGNPRDVAFNSDGSKMYIVGSSNDTVFQYTLSTPWNVGTATYDNISKDISSQEGTPYDVAFNPDGSKMYIVGSSNDTVFQYTLSTPWNVGTATYDNISKDISSQEGNPRAVAFNPDGSKMYIMGYSNNTVFQYTVGGTTEYDYVQIDLDLPNDTTKFLDGDGIWRVLVEADISDLDNTDSIRNKAEDNTFIDTTGKSEGKTLVFDDEGNLVVGDAGSDEFEYIIPASNQTYSAIKDTGIVGEAVVFGDLLYFKWSDKKYWKARANSAATAEVVAMAVEAKSANNSCVIIRQGYVRNDSWSAFTDSIVYLSTATAGKMQSSVPDSSGDQIKRVGQAVDSKIIFFNPSQDIGEVK